jgi:hypothetical protein
MSYNINEKEIIIAKVKESLQAEDLRVSPNVKQNLTAAFRAKHQSPVILAMNRGIPLWKVAASLLLLIGVFSWLRPFEKETIVQTEPTIQIEEKIIRVTDTVFVEKIVEKVVIEYVEVPSTTKTNIKNDIPMAVNAMENSIEKVIYHKTVDLESLIDNYYDTAMVENIDRQIRGKSMSDSDIPTFY